MKNILFLTLVLLTYVSGAQAATRNLQCFTAIGVDDSASGIYGLHLRDFLPLAAFAKKAGAQAQTSLVLKDEDGQVLGKVAVSAVLLKNKKQASASLAIYDSSNNLIASNAGDLVVNKANDDFGNVHASTKVSLNARLDAKKVGYADISYVDDVQVTSISFYCNLR